MDNLTSREIDIRGGHALHQVPKIIGQQHTSIYFIYNSFIILLERKFSLVFQFKTFILFITSLHHSTLFKMKTTLFLALVGSACAG